MLFRSRLRIHPKVLNMQVAKPERLVVNSKDESVKATLQTIYGKAPQEKEDIVVLNASAALVVAKIASDLKDGIALARAAIKNGDGRNKLSQIIQECGDIEKLRDAEKNFL